MATQQPSMFQDLLNKLIGSQTDTNVDETLDVKNLINQLVNSVQNQQTQQQSNQQNNQQQVSSGTTQQTTSTNADISALQKVFQQQQAGVTPDMLAAIFSEGSKAAPQLAASTANAVGARSGANSPLATALTELNSNLTNQAANLNAKMLADSGNTAAQIAELTKQQTTLGNNQGTAGTTGSTITGTSGSTNTTGQQSTDTNQHQTSVRDQDTKQASTINVKSAGLTAMAAMMASLLGGGSGTDWLGKLTSGGAGLSGLDFNSLFTNGFGSGMDWLGGAGNPFSDLSASGSIPDFAGGGADFGFDPTFGLDGGDLFGNLFGFADGGLVAAPQLKLGEDEEGKKKSAVDPMIAMMLQDDPSTGFQAPGIGGQVQQQPSPQQLQQLKDRQQGSADQKLGQLIANIGGDMLGLPPIVSNLIGKTFGEPIGGFVNSVGDVAGDVLGVVGDAVGDIFGGIGDLFGFADGGLLPPELADPKGITDSVVARLSGGEYIVPADVVKHPGVLQLLEQMRHALHTPAHKQ